MMNVESVTIRTAKNGFTVEPQLPFDPYPADGPSMVGKGPSPADIKARRDASRPRVATSVEDALTMAADMLGTPCDVTPSVDNQTGVDSPDSSLTSDPSEMF